MTLKTIAPGELKVEHLNLHTEILPTQHWIPSLIVKVIQGEKGFGVKISWRESGLKLCHWQ